MIANFFKRAEQSLIQALKAPNPSVLEKHLNSSGVAVAFDDESFALPNTRITLRLAINILSRLYPNIGVVFSGRSDQGFSMRDELVHLALSINPELEFMSQESEFAVALCLGNPAIKATTKVFACSDSWNVEIGIDSPTNIVTGKVFNPFSAAAASCLAAGEVFNIIFSDYLPQREFKGFVLSLLDYEKRPSAPFELPAVHFNDLTMVGLGAIANATVWAIQYIPEITGSIVLIDPEKVDLTNLQRYALADQDSVNLLKVDLAAKCLCRKGLTVKPFSLGFGDYVAQYRSGCDFELIAVSVDNEETRVAAQAILPRFVLNGWTRENGLLGLSRHAFSGPQACLACLYLVTAPRKSRAEEIAEITGCDTQRTSEMLVRQTPLSRSFLEEVSKSKGYPLDVLLRWEGQYLDRFFSEAVCGGALLDFSGDQSFRHEVLVPLAHQSMLAGVLLGCEIVKTVLNVVPSDFPTETRLNVLSFLEEYIVFPRGKTANCICQDEDYLEVYRQKWE